MLGDVGPGDSPRLSTAYVHPVSKLAAKVQLRSSWVQGTLHIRPPLLSSFAYCIFSKSWEVASRPRGRDTSPSQTQLGLASTAHHRTWVQRTLHALVPPSPSPSPWASHGGASTQTRSTTRRGAPAPYAWLTWVRGRRGWHSLTPFSHVPPSTPPRVVSGGGLTHLPERRDGG